ncbi:MAG: hypothetical protein ABUK01_05205 [Leptospirales bacterium]
MNSITEIIQIAPPEYIQYFAKKTGFLMTGAFETNNQTRWLWHHIVRTYEFKNRFNTLTNSEKKSMTILLNNFGRTPFADETGFALEKKAPWVFKHPAGGIFIPLEMIKLLMQEDYFQKQYYLFTLLYKLKLKEQNILASLTGSSLEGQLAISFEKNPLDMGLVLYIWFSAKIRTLTDIRSMMPPKAKIIMGPYTFAREEDKPKKKDTSLQVVFPEKPVNLWDYLFLNFPHLKKDTEKAYTLMAEGKKGFYRSLNLINNPSNEYINLFKNGLLFPVLSSSAISDSRVKNIQVVSPAEVRHHYRDTIKTKNKSGKNL